MLEFVAAVAGVLLIVFLAGHWARRDERALMATLVRELKNEYGRDWGKLGSCQQNRIEGYWLACDSIAERLGGEPTGPARDPIHERRKQKAREEIARVEALEAVDSPARRSKAALN